MQLLASRDSGWNAPRLRHKRLAVSAPVDDGSRPCRERLRRDRGAAGWRVGIEMRVVACAEAEGLVDRAPLRRRFAFAIIGSMTLGLTPAFAFDGSTSSPPEKIPEELHRPSAGAARRRRRSERRRRRLVGRRSHLRGRRRTGDRALETRRDVRRRHRRAARRRQGLPLLQPAGRRLRRGPARPAQPQRDLQRFRRGRRLLPERHPQQRRPARPAAARTNCSSMRRRPSATRTRSTISPTCTWSARAASPRTISPPFAGWRWRPRRAMRRRRRCSAICCSSATACAAAAPARVDVARVRQRRRGRSEGRVDPRALPARFRARERATTGRRPPPCTTRAPRGRRPRLRSGTSSRRSSGRLAPLVGAAAAPAARSEAAERSVRSALRARSLSVGRLLTCIVRRRLRVRMSDVGERA